MNKHDDKISVTNIFIDSYPKIDDPTIDGTTTIGLSNQQHLSNDAPSKVLCSVTMCFLRSHCKNHDFLHGDCGSLHAPHAHLPNPHQGYKRLTDDSNNDGTDTFTCTSCAKPCCVASVQEKERLEMTRVRGKRVVQTRANDLIDGHTSTVTLEHTKGTAAQAKQRRNIFLMLSVELFNVFSYRESYFATIDS